MCTNVPLQRLIYLYTHLLFCSSSCFYSLRLCHVCLYGGEDCCLRNNHTLDTVYAARICEIPIILIPMRANEPKKGGKNAGKKTQANVELIYHVGKVLMTKLFIIHLYVHLLNLSRDVVLLLQPPLSQRCIVPALVYGVCACYIRCAHLTWTSSACFALVWFCIRQINIWNDENLLERIRRHNADDA